MSRHYKEISNNSGTNLTIGPGAYLSVGKDGTDIMVRGNGKVFAFDTWQDLIDSIDETKPVYCKRDE